jgi:hypothetical protein
MYEDDLNSNASPESHPCLEKRGGLIVSAPRFMDVFDLGFYFYLKACMRFRF